MNVQRQADADGAIERARSLLAERFGHASFLPGQEAALRSVLSKRSLLVVMPTGSGKSLVYQLPALMESGLTLVISPLIALMKDQVDALRQAGVRAAALNSGLPAGEAGAVSLPWSLIVPEAPTVELPVTVRL